MRQCRGFTAIELVIVVAIVAVSLTLAIGKMGSTISKSKLRSATEGIFNSIAFSRSEAIKRGETIKLTVSADGSCRVETRVDNELTVIKSVPGATGVVVSSNNGSLDMFFGPNGKPNQTVTYRVLPSSGDCSDNLCMNIEISEHGRIKMCNPYSTSEIVKCS